MANKEKKNNWIEKLKSFISSFDIGLFLLVTGVAANFPLWIGAFMAGSVESEITQWIHEVFLPPAFGVAGFAMAITVGFGLIYVAVQLTKMQPTSEKKLRGRDEYKTEVNWRYWIAIGSVIVLLIISAFILGPQAYVDLSKAPSMYAMLGEDLSKVWAALRVLAGDLALIAIGLVRGVHFGSRAPAKGTTRTATSATNSDSGKPRTPKKSVAPASDLRLCEYGCGIEYKHPNGKGGHMKKHHPELLIIKGTPAQMVLPINQNKKVEK